MSDGELPQFPGGPDPNLPIPREAVEGLSLTQYGALLAELVAAPTKRAEILRAHRLDELQWNRVEQTWLLRVATAAMKRDLSFQAELDEAFGQRRAQLRTSEGQHHDG